MESNTRIIGGVSYPGPALNIVDRLCRECPEWLDNPGRCKFWNVPAARKQPACIAFRERHVNKHSERTLEEMRETVTQLAYQRIFPQED